MEISPSKKSEFLGVINEARAAKMSPVDSF